MAAEFGPELFELYRSRPRVAILMSGVGSNARSILASEEVRDLYDITTIVTDNQYSNARAIADEHSLESITAHQDRFFGSIEREDYFKSLANYLGDRGVQGAVYAGFMKITPELFTRRFPGLNIHPANLQITDGDGRPKYRGMDALPAMRRDLGYVQSTVHVVDAAVDEGAAIALTKPLVVSQELTDNAAHELLKHEERYAFPATLLLVGSGKLQFGEGPPILASSSGEFNE